MKRLKISLILVIISSVFSAGVARAEIYNNHFASILLSGKKIGHVQYSTEHSDEGELQELKTRASLSILGYEVYHHTLHTHEVWEMDEMKRLWGHANEDGTEYVMDITRKPDNYTGSLNKKVIKLPANTFPTAVWHYAITEHTQLFSIPELRLLNVKIKKSPDTVKIGNKKVPAEKFVFSGDWNATLWFDHDKQFLKWQYKVKGRKVVVQLDP